MTLCILQAAELPGQVEALLRAVNTTNDFESELAARFGDASPAEVHSWPSAQQVNCLAAIACQSWDHQHDLAAMSMGQRLQAM